MRVRQEVVEWRARERGGVEVRTRDLRASGKSERGGEMETG